ncbi:Sec1 domain containing protein 1, partial [Branchiostoma belcheri]
MDYFSAELPKTSVMPQPCGRARPAGGSIAYHNRPRTGPGSSLCGPDRIADSGYPSTSSCGQSTILPKIGVTKYLNQPQPTSTVRFPVYYAVYMAALKRMLNLNQEPSRSSAVEPVWKVLVYDRFGQDIISPILSVPELRDMGVTLHLCLNAVEVQEWREIDRKDLRSQLYESYYLNFISAVSRQRLEDLASAALQAGTVPQISKVFDQYLNFITLEDDMFTLRHSQNREAISYYAINRGDVQDSEMEASMDAIVDSLFSVFVTLGTVPIIRSPRGNAAEMVAEKLDKKLRENIRDSRNSLFTSDSLQAGQFSFQRPLLVILDRNLDLATPLHHTWTYQALAHDVLDLQLNRVSVEEPAGEKSPQGARPKRKAKSYDLNFTDKFWQSHKG